jgi:cytochrome P450
VLSGLQLAAACARRTNVVSSMRGYRATPSFRSAAIDQVVDQHIAHPPPGPMALPAIGSSINFVRFLSDPVGFMSRMHARYGNTVSLVRSDAKYVFAFGADHNRDVLGDAGLFHNLDASSLPFRVPPHSALGRLFGGLIQMNGERHVQQRRLIMPAFAKPMAKPYLEDIVAVTQAHLASWRVGECRDIAQEMKNLSLSIAVRLLLGIDPAGAGDEIRSLLEAWIRLVFSMAAMMLPFNLPALPYRRLLDISDRLEAEIRAIIARKRADASGRPCALTALMHAHDQDSAMLSEDELVGHTNFLFMAGHATVANALTWTIFLLERHPKVFDDVRAECAAWFGSEQPSPEALQRLTLLDFVVKESIRLLPPVIWWCKVATVPFALGPYRFPAATKVIQSAYITHRDPKLYPSPQAFLPERWSRLHPDPYAYCPFSAGPRMCLGSTVATLEIKVVIALLLARFRPTLPRGCRVDAKGPMILEPKAGLPMFLNSPDAKPPLGSVRGNVHALVDLPMPAESG